MTAKEFIEQKTGYVPNTLLSQAVTAELMERYLKLRLGEAETIIKKWDNQVELHRRVYSDALMYTKEERLLNSHYAQAICAVKADVEELYKTLSDL